MRFIVASFVLIMLSFSADAGRPYPSDMIGKNVPEFGATEAEEWIGSKALKTEELKGKVWIVNFWTFACWNCYRSFPWLNSVYEKYNPQGLEIVGVHTPEFDREKKIENVKAKIKEYELKHPIFIDNDFAYWKAFRNKFWPTYYLIDKQGVVRNLFVGETHKDSSGAKEIEARIKQLLDE